MAKNYKAPVRFFAASHSHRKTVVVTVIANTIVVKIAELKKE